MATPAQIMPRLEGLVSSGLRTGAAPMAYQRAAIWKDLMRAIMFSTVLRDATDWTLGSDQDVIATGANGELDASGGVVYGFLIDSIFDVASEALFVILTDSTDQTLSGVALGDGGAAIFGDEEEGVLVKIPTAASSTTPQIHGYVFPNGIVCATNIQFAADGDEGTDPTANDVRVHAIYRETVEVRV